MIVDDERPTLPPPAPPDVSRCCACWRTVTGRSPDVKVATPVGVLCFPCSYVSVLVPRAL